MKKNHILKVILLSTSIILTTNMIGSIAKASENQSEEKKVLEAIRKCDYVQDDFSNTKQLVTKSGYVRDYYEEGDDLYIIFDEVEFFTDNQAKEEYLKDGNPENPETEWGFDYYIRNKDKSTKIYKVSNNSKLELLAFETGEDNTINLVTVTKDQLKNKIDKYKNCSYSEGRLLFHIDECNNVVNGMRSIFIP